MPLPTLTSINPVTLLAGGAGIAALATRILRDCHPSWIDRLVHDGVGDTGAQFQLRCSEQALALFWSKDTQSEAPNGFHREIPAGISLQTPALH